ncbi:IclR family transcriptional regulator [Aminivibrio sp.]|uniref:IclR family transcriptional regulator n=1 Tax=Aminivibrio sp. TaxID=1872489 RepID=UPI001A5A79E0|nr:IclR family transcriptional regulator [Aminivibrio sp.]MBL3538489.1 IclR family transcriptional regulator [Aminivibrio sp.]
MEEKKYKLKLLEKTSEIFACFDLSHPKLTFSEILKLKPNLDRTAVYRILINLHELGFLELDKKTNSFSIGAEIYRLAYIGIRSFELREVINPFINKLRDETKETVIVNVVQNNHGVCIERIQGIHNISITANPGRVVPLLRGASGKILAAHLPHEELRKIYEKEKDSLRGKSFESVLEEMGQIRKKGYDTTFADLDPDTAGVSFPIFANNMEVIAGVSVIGPVFRFTPDALENIVSRTRVCVSNISEKLKYILIGGNKGNV